MQKTVVLIKPDAFGKEMQTMLMHGCEILSVSDVKTQGLGDKDSDKLNYDMSEKKSIWDYGM